MKKMIFALAILTLLAFTLVHAEDRLSLVQAHKALDRDDLMCKKSDISKNGMVSGADYALVKPDLGRNDCSGENRWCERKDVNRDHFVDSNDLEMIRSKFGCTY